MTPDTQNIAIELINEPPQAMRTEIDRDAIFELAADIQKNGLINPITVRPIGDRFEVVAGHRRLLAHRFGGITQIRCIVRELDDDAAFGIMTSENLARENVNPVDEATHTKRLYDRAGGDLVKTAAVLNRSRDWVASRLLIAEMSDDLKSSLRDGKIKLGVALALAEITDDNDRSTCLGMAISQGASVIVAQYWLAQWRAGLFGTSSFKEEPDPNDPDRAPRVVMLRCAVDGKEHPATDMVSVLIARANVGYLDALRSHLDSLPVETELLESAPPLSSPS